MAVKKFNIDKYKDKKSYNGQAVPDGMVLAPFWMKKDFQRDSSICVSENFTTWEFGGFHFLIGFAPIAKDAFTTYMHFFWSEINEYLDKKRTGRCILGKNPDGTPIICPKTNCCTGCPEKGKLERYNPKSDKFEIISLDFCYEDDDFDVTDPSQITPEDALLEKDLEAGLLKYLHNVKPRYADIAKFSKAGFTPKEIIDKIGLKSSRGYQEIDNAYKLTLEYLHLKRTRK